MMPDGRFVIGVRFCGDCNPTVDTSRLLRRLKSLDGCFKYVMWQEGGYDALLILSGCLNDCTERPPAAGRAVVVVAGESVDAVLVPEDRLAGEVLRTLLDLFGRSYQG